MAWTNWENVAKYDDFLDIIYEKKYHIDLKGGIARVTINRPKKYNAFTNKTLDEMFHAFYDASHDQAIGVVVLTGAGDKAFCTGGDVEWEEKGLREQFYWRYPPNQLLRMCRKPVIAQVKGYAIGAGNHIAYMSDFTIAADNAIFGQNGPRVASPADGYIVAYLTRVVGAKKARELWMLCRKYNAQQALEMGLINAVVPLDKLEEEVDKWCEEILSLSPGCMEILKAAFDADTDYMEGSYGKLSRLIYPDWFEMKECAEGPQAFMEKRKPEFWRIRQEESAKNK
ncbi:MAG: enoyl-CoA hydratase-related protein [Bacillota bacterium]